MDPSVLAQRLCAFPRRAAGTDAERRAAQWLQGTLRASGRRAEIEPHWVSPHGPAALSLHAALGAIASVVSVNAPEVGVAALAALLVSLVLDLTGRAFLLRRLLPQRATQNVVSPPSGPQRPVRLVVAAHYDAPRSGLVYRERIQRAVVRLPRPYPLLVLAFAALLATAALRARGEEGTLLGLVQLAPTVVLIVAVAILLDVALSDPVPGANDNASGVAVAVALAGELVARPPRMLEVEVVLAGAGADGALGMRGYVARRRRVWPREGTVVLALRACARGRVRYETSEGALWPLRLHPRLVELCAEVAARAPHLAAGPVAGRSPTSAHPARVARFPAIAVGCRDEHGVVPGARQHSDLPDRVQRRSMDDALEFCLALVDLLDADLAERLGPAAG